MSNIGTVTVTVKIVGVGGPVRVKILSFLAWMMGIKLHVEK